MVGAVIPWAPPQPNWNAWNACNIDEGYLANASLDDLCNDLENSTKDKRQNDAEYQVCKDLALRSVFNIFECIFFHDFNFRNFWNFAKNYPLQQCEMR